MSDDRTYESRAPVSVSVVMGSKSDLPVMGAAAAVLDEFGVPNDVRVVSAHRTPHDMVAIGSATTAGLLAVRMSAIQNPELHQSMTTYRESLSQSSRESGIDLRSERSSAGGHPHEEQGDRK